jgi:hypothetical protein
MQFKPVEKVVFDYYDKFNSSISNDQNLLNTINRDRQDTITAVIEMLDKEITDEPLYVGKTQYEFYKGDIRWVVNQALTDIITKLQVITHKK